MKITVEYDLTYDQDYAYLNGAILFHWDAFESLEDEVGTIWEDRIYQPISSAAVKAFGGKKPKGVK